MARLLSVLLVLFHLSFSFGQDLVSASIAQDTSYLNQKECVKNCIWGSNDLMPGIGCSSPWINECLCRADQAPPASRFLTSCVRSGCGSSASDDISRAVSVYDGYCVGAGFTDAHGAPAETTPPNTDPQAPTVTQVTLVTETAKTGSASSQSSATSVLSIPPVTRHITSTIRVYPSETAQSPPRSAGLTQSDKIALILGLVIGLPGTVATIWMCCYAIRRRI
ncbi:hypothetical protein P154DRAFT_585485 [Amniculicola lignicola CBS 123094]|uniref:Extracellular membrane protein CFEM domain-containing protein n=1 Tax=Amniculicola lignicola CBS 123094 TaxID=1392246 RepID=A0A6A5W0L9_9PLEO|nr:hypothetical protein P154DRAFT_585485 [Amniculicola lignicola CBS 123094]